jgi:hypothetical protein
MSQKTDAVVASTIGIDTVIKMVPLTAMLSHAEMSLIAENSHSW